MPSGSLSPARAEVSLLPWADIPCGLGECVTSSVTSSPYRHSLQTTNGVTQHLLNPLAPRALAHTPTSQLL